MKQKDLETAPIEAPEKQRRIDIPLSADCRAMLFFHGDPDAACFARLHEYVGLMELAILGVRPEPVVAPKPARPRPAVVHTVETEIEEDEVPRGRSTYTALSGSIAVGCSKRHFQRLAVDVLHANPNERSRIFSRAEIDSLKEHWESHRRKYLTDAEVQAESNLEQDLEEAPVRPRRQLPPCAKHPDSPRSPERNRCIACLQEAGRHMSELRTKRQQQERERQALVQ